MNPFKALNKWSIYSYYLPLSGVITYHLFAVHIYCPGLFRRLIPSLPIPTVLLYHTHIGLGLYAYTRSHIQCLDKNRRVVYTFFTTGMFTFASILMWITLSNLISENIILRLIMASSSFTFIGIAKDYLSYVDSLLLNKKCSEDTKKCTSYVFDPYLPKKIDQDEDV